MTGAAISAWEPCRGPQCLARTGELDPDCPRCGGVGSLAWGTDPSCLAGCCVDGEECECENGHATITIGVGQHGTGVSPDD